jgi:CrcB protein
MAQPVDPRVLGLTIAGGAVGVLARGLIVMPITDPAVVPWVTLAINAVGSLLLGVIVGWLADRHPLTRSFLGTGVMGGFTTYSAFAVALAGWAATPWLAAGLAAASVIAGVAGAIAGLFLGRRIADVPGEVEAVEDAQ